MDVDGSHNILPLYKEHIRTGVLSSAAFVYRLLCVNGTNYTVKFSHVVVVAAVETVR